MTRSAPASSAALAWGLGLERAAQVGCMLAAYVVETVGTQEYTFTAEAFLGRLDDVLRRRRGVAGRPHLSRGLPWTRAYRWTRVVDTVLDPGRSRATRGSEPRLRRRWWAATRSPDRGCLMATVTRDVEPHQDV